MIQQAIEPLGTILILFVIGLYQGQELQIAFGFALVIGLLLDIRATIK